MTNTIVIAALSDQLREGIDVHRCAAARALGRIADPGSIDVLCNALLDEDPDVRTDAAAALGQFADPQTADNLLENLIGDPCCEVKISAIDALVKMQHAPLIPWLRRLVATRDEGIAWDDEEFYGGTWDDWLDVQLAAIRGLGELGASEGVAEICAAFHDEMGQDVSEHAIDALRRMGAPGAAALGKLYEGGEVQLRRRIASAIGVSSDQNLEALRERCLQDKSAAVRCAAVIGLAMADPSDERLATFYDDPDPEIRRQVIERSGQCFAELTRQSLQDGVPAVKCAAFKIVSERPDLFDEEGFGDLIRKSVAGHPLVSGEAAIAWTALTGSKALAALRTSFIDTEQPVVFRRLLIQALKRLGGDAVDTLATAAGDDDRQIRIDTLTALAGIAKSEEAWPGPAGQVLLAALDGELIAPPAEKADGQPEQDEAEPSTGDGEQDEAEHAEQAESNAGKASTLDVILSGADDADSLPQPDTEPEIELTADDLERMALAKRRAISKKKVSLDVEVAPYQDVRRFAARVLGDIANEDVADKLIAALDEDDNDLRLTALDSLAQIGVRTGALPELAIAPLLNLIDGKAHELRMPAARALAFVPSAEAKARLHDLLGDDDIHVRLEAVRGLERQGETDEDVAALLSDEYPGIRLAVANVLARTQGIQALDALVAFAFADDGMYRREAGRLLRDIAPAEATRRFLDVLADDDRRRDWLVAIDALGELSGDPETTEALAAA